MSLISDVKLWVVNKPGKVLANGSFLVSNAFRVKFTLMKNDKGMFVGLPGEYYEKDGQKKWSAKVECTDDAAGNEMKEAIIAEYNKRSGKQTSSSTSKPTQKTEESSYPGDNIDF